jgi:D-arabinose 1-dehydrogenase-like Zn-dependent alcohol dehydrogenase
MADIPKKAKAALLVGYHKPMEIAEVPIPDKLEPNSILVRTGMATICASDVHSWEGDTGNASGNPKFPRILGHEMMGYVARLGPGVTKDSVGQPLKEGDRIIWTHGFCGQCYNCVVERQLTLCLNRRNYMSDLATEYPYLVGGFASYGYVFPISGRIKIPDGIPDEVASAAACAMRTVVSSFDRLGELDNRHTVVIQGSGPLGLFATAIAARKGPREVIVIGGPKRRLEVAKKWGATRTIDIADVKDAARKEMVMQWTDGLGPDVVMEFSGVRPAFPEGMDMIRRGGRYVVVGQLHNDSVEFKPASVVMKHVSIIGNMSGVTEHYYRALQFIKHNPQISWMDMISNHYPLERINEAMAKMKTWEEIKPAITFQS